MNTATHNTTITQFATSWTTRLTVASAILLGAACSQPPATAAHAHVTPAELGLSRISPPQDTCSRFTIIALSSDTTTDRGPADARRRAAQQFGTPALANHLDGEGRDHNWPLLVQHQATVQVSTTPITDDQPPATPTRTAAGVIAHRSATAADGWRHQLPSIAAYCTLTSDIMGWKITAVTFADTNNGIVR